MIRTNCLLFFWGKGGLKNVLMRTANNALLYKKILILSWLTSAYALVYFPQIWSMNTDAIKRRDITKTGTGPLKELFKNLHKLMNILESECKYLTYTLTPGLSSV